MLPLKRKESRCLAVQANSLEAQGTDIMTESLKQEVFWTEIHSNELRGQSVNDGSSKVYALLILTWTSHGIDDSMLSKRARVQECTTTAKLRRG